MINQFSQFSRTKVKSYIVKVIYCRAQIEVEKINILIASSIDQDAITKLSADNNVQCEFNAPEDQLISLIQDQDVLIFRSGVTISRQVLERGKQLKLLIRAGS